MIRQVFHSTVAVLQIDKHLWTTRIMVAIFQLLKCFCSTEWSDPHFDFGLDELRLFDSDLHFVLHLIFITVLDGRWDLLVRLQKGVYGNASLKAYSHCKPRNSNTVTAPSSRGRAPLFIPWCSRDGTFRSLGKDETLSWWWMVSKFAQFDNFKSIISLRLFCSVIALCCHIATLTNFARKQSIQNCMTGTIMCIIRLTTLTMTTERK